MSPLYIGLIIAGVGVLLALGGLLARRTAGKILSTPLARTGDAARANGITSCEGAVRAQHTLTAPCTGAPCVYYRLTIEKKVKEKRGNQTTTRWKKIHDQHQGSVFALDDGSGPITIDAREEVDGDLEKTFSGPPPGGPGLGGLAALVASSARPGLGEEVLEYRATEHVVRADAKLFALGAAQAGHLTRPGSGKLTLSTRGRDATVGSAKRKALALFVAGGLAAVGGATVAVLRPGEARACGDLVDVQSECAVTSDVVEADRLQPDGTNKHERFRRSVLTWKVTKAGKYELAARDPKKRRALPTIQVENSIGMPMNIDLGIGLGAGAYATTTKTTTLSPGTYSVFVFSLEQGPEKLLLEIREAATK